MVNLLLRLTQWAIWLALSYLLLVASSHYPRWVTMAAGYCSFFLWAATTAVGRAVRDQRETRRSVEAAVRASQIAAGLSERPVGRPDPQCKDCLGKGWIRYEEDPAHRTMCKCMLND